MASGLIGYPEISPYQVHHLTVDHGHTLYVEEVGNPAGIPIVFLHGGPGAGCSPQCRTFFDPKVYRVILFDQRGCGRSRPLGECLANTTQRLVQDIETIRHHLGIDRWFVFGGSWGSTLALYYAKTHIKPILGLILRGIFLARPHEITWFIEGGVRQFFPDAWQALHDNLALNQAPSLLKRMAQACQDPAQQSSACHAWIQYEHVLATGEDLPAQPEEAIISFANIEQHYLSHQCFLDEPILQAIEHVASVPTWICQGRHDWVCPPISAWDLKQALPHATLQWVEQGMHSSFHPLMKQALVDVMDGIARTYA